MSKKRSKASMKSGIFFFSSRRRHTRCSRDWNSDVCSSDLGYWDLVPTLYDLQTDPVEATDVYPARPEVVRAMFDRFKALTDEVATGAKQPKKGGAD